MKAVFTTISILALTASTSAFAPATNAFSRQSSISTAIFSEVATPEINELDFENVDLVRALGSRRLKGMLRTMKRERAAEAREEKEAEEIKAKRVAKKARYEARMVARGRK